MLEGAIMISVDDREEMRVHALAALKEEREVQASSSWGLQMKTVNWIVM